MPNPPTNIVPTNIAWIKLSGKIPRKSLWTWEFILWKSLWPAPAERVSSQHNNLDSGDNYNYCGNFKTNEIVYEYGTFEIVQGKRTDWDCVHELVTQSKSVYEIVSLVPSKYPRAP